MCVHIGVCCTVFRVHSEQKRGEAVQGVQERLPHGHQRVSAQVPVQTRGDRAPDLWKQGESFFFNGCLYMLVMSFSHSFMFCLPL